MHSVLRWNVIKRHETAIAILQQGIQPPWGYLASYVVWKNAIAFSAFALVGDIQISCVNRVFAFPFRHLGIDMALMSDADVLAMVHYDPLTCLSVRASQANVTLLPRTQAEPETAPRNQP
jgi:hypothetical protein